VSSSWTDGHRTGYEDARVGWRAIFGDEIIERAGPAWGLDAEGEVVGQYRPTGQPGVRTYCSFFLRLACSHRRVCSCGTSGVDLSPDAGDRRTWCVPLATRLLVATDPGSQGLLIQAEHLGMWKQ
jgi:hypothetical protein